MLAVSVPTVIRPVAVWPIWLCNSYHNDGIGDDVVDVRSVEIGVCGWDDWDVCGDGVDDGVIDCVCHFDLIHLLEVKVYCWLYNRRLTF